MAYTLGPWPVTDERITGVSDAALAIFNVASYGAVGNGVHDDTAALTACAVACLAAGGLYTVPKSFVCKITSTLDLRYLNLDIKGRIVVGHTSGVGVQIGGSSSSTVALRLFVNEVVYGGVQTNIALRVIGLKNAEVAVNRCEYMQLYADATLTADSSIAYSKFTLGKIDKLELYGEAGVSWINSNHFYGGRIATLTVTGIGYSHNGNHFWGPTIENATVTFNTGNSNHLHAIRGEGTVTVTFGATATDNTIEQEWLSNPTATWTTLTVTDNGFRNDVFTGVQARTASRTLFRIDANSKTTNQCSAWIMPHATNRIRPGFKKLTLPAAADYIDTGIFPVTAGPSGEGAMALSRLRFQSDASIWRPKVYVYDSSMTALDGTSTDYIALTGGWTWNGSGYYSFGSNQGVTPKRIVFNHPDVKYARIVLLGNSTATPFAYVQLTALVTAPYGDEIVDLIRRQMERPLFKANTTVPTHALLQAGDSIGTSTGRHLVIARADTTLSVAAVSTDTTITVASATGITSGDSIAVLLDDDTTHFTTVNGAPVGSVITLTDAMPGAAAIGKNVAALRWLHIT